MNKVLRCTMLSALFVTGLAAFCIGGSLSPPTAVSTPAVDQAILASYGGAVHGADVRFTINEDGSVGDIEIVSSSGSSAVDAALVATISTWRFNPARDSNGNPVASSKTEYIDF